jgi:hypothetical protein
MPFVTEEIYGYLPAGESEALVVHPFPQADHALLDVDAEARIGAAIELTRALRRWRDLAGVAPGQVLDARTLGEAPHDLVARLARVSFAGDGRPIATVGGVELVETEGLDAAAVEGRVEERRAKLRGARRSWATRASWRRPPRTWWTKSVASSRRTGPNLKNSVEGSAGRARTGHHRGHSRGEPG